MLALMAIGACGGPGPGTAGPPGPGKPAPEFSLVSLDGPSYSLSGQRGHVVLVNFWATWCIPCRAEMPELEVTYRKYQPRGADFLGIDWKEGRDSVKPFVDERQVTYPILLDSSGQVFLSYDSTPSPPETFIIDRQGKVLVHRIGLATRDWFDQQLKAAGA